MELLGIKIEFLIHASLRIKIHLLPGLNKNILRIDSELVCLLVSGFQKCVEVTLDPMVALGSNFVLELTIKL